MSCIRMNTILWVDILTRMFSCLNKFAPYPVLKSLVPSSRQKSSPAISGSAFPALHQEAIQPDVFCRCCIQGKGSAQNKTSHSSRSNPCHQRSVTLYRQKRAFLHHSKLRNQEQMNKCLARAARHPVLWERESSSHPSVQNMCVQARRLGTMRAWECVLQTNGSPSVCIKSPQVQYAVTRLLIFCKELTGTEKTKEKPGNCRCPGQMPQLARAQGAGPVSYTGLVW